MKYLAWKPPAELAKQALSPEPGGGVPSLIVEHERPFGPQRDWRWTGEYRIIDEWNTPQDGHTALLLALDDQPCLLSISRAASLHGNIDCSSPALAVETLVVWLGGDLVSGTLVSS